MHGSASPLSASAWLLVLLGAVSGAYCLRRARGWGGAAAGEAVMGFGMALMAVPLGDGGAWRAPVLGAVFCAAAVHALWLLRGGAHHAHHLVGSLTMVYMVYGAAAAGSGGGQGHGHGTGLPLLTGALLLYYAGYVVLGGTRLITAGGAAPAPSPASPAPPCGAPAELARACRLAMGMGMLAMLPAM
ncbi:DUF5134 domain-containing protein [Streptomyces amritsarensis]|uniref:DUF5134 domain-containing protein n=1 Tax=Streptomyces amritsarensis TaxID=681158 RepID=A0ABX3G0Q9_9ACTN|nr:DUF5134 domain-containing protein [Streptomyces amritsarensis]OLZ64295.1 DUF5134 domain-containing protein [Streptomyces amritsarensis]